MSFDASMRPPFWVELSDGADAFVVSLWSVAARPHARHALLREHSPRARTMSVVSRADGRVQSVMFQGRVFPFPSSVFRQWPATLVEAGVAERDGVAGDDEAEVMLDTADV